MLSQESVPGGSTQVTVSILGELGAGVNADPVPRAESNL